MILMKKLRLFVLYLGLACLLFACKEDTEVIDTTDMSEEDIYFADYEPSVYKWGFIDESGRLVIKDSFDNTRDFSDGLAATNLKGKWGYIDTDGKKQIAFKYRSAFPFKNGIARIQNFDKLYGFINTDGEEVIPPKHVEAYDLSDGLIKLKTNGGYNFININGDTLLSEPVSKVNNFKNGYAVAKDFGKETLIDVSGKLLLDYKYDKVYLPENNMVKVRLDKKYGYVDLNGKNLIPIAYDKLSGFQDGIAAAKKNGDWLLINTKNNIQKELANSVQNIISMNENKWMVSQAGKFAIMNNKGEMQTDLEFDALNKFHESIAVYELNGAYGYVGINGQKITGPDFPLCWDFVGDKARAIFDGGVGFLNKQGKPVIPAIFFEVRDFHDGLSRVQVYR